MTSHDNQVNFVNFYRSDYLQKRFIFKNGFPLATLPVILTLLASYPLEMACNPFIAASLIF